MPSKYWIKLYHEILDDPKMGRLPDNLWRRTTELFLIAGDLDAEGYLPSVGDMAWRLRLDEDALESELQELAAVSIVEQRDGQWLVTNFAKRQAPVDNAERQSRYRNRKRKELYSDNEHSNESVTNDITTCNTDTDTDTDTEENMGASAPPPNLDGWLESVRTAKNKQAALRFMHMTLYPKHEALDYSYIGRTAKTVGGAGRLVTLLWQSQAQRVDGDVMRYCMAMAKNKTPPNRQRANIDASMDAVNQVIQEARDAEP